MDPSTLLFIISIVVVLGFIGILLSLRKSVRIKRFTRKHPDAVWVHYSGPSDSRISFDSFETGNGMSFDLGPDKRGIVVLPGPICVKISFSMPSSGDNVFTQTVRFTAVRDKSYTLEVDENHRIMRVFTR